MTTASFTADEWATAAKIAETWGSPNLALTWAYEARKARAAEFYAETLGLIAVGRTEPALVIGVALLKALLADGWTPPDGNPLSGSWSDPSVD